MADLSENEKQHYRDIIGKVRQQQSIGHAVFTGTLAAICGSVLWAYVAIQTGYFFSFVAVLVGAAIGFVVQFVGKGVEVKFSFLGMALAIFSCLLGYYLCFIRLQMYAGYSVNDALSIPLSEIFKNIGHGFWFMDLIFLVIAAGMGFIFARRKLNPHENDAFFKEEVGLLD